MTIFLAEDLRQGEAQPMEDERIETGWFTLKQVEEMIADGRIRDAKTIIGWAALRCRLRPGAQPRQVIEQLPQRRAAVRHLHFRLRVQLGEGSPERRIQEERVVAEALRARRLVQDDAFRLAAECGQDAALTGERDHADEARAAVRRAGQALEQQPVVGLVGAFRREARRPHARGAAQRVHDEAGVVGEQEFIAICRIMQRLFDGVFFESLAVFLAGRQAF